jgi:U3 small nucleolar RNA-associated protein 13
MILCLTTSADRTLLVSGSKDQTARIHSPNPATDGDWSCIGICEGHAESIGALTLSRKTSPPQFLITASQDRTLKLWDLSALPLASEQNPTKPKSLSTLRAHEKDINSLDLSPNDKFLASGSQDKLVKIFAVDYPGGGIKLAGTCKGHRRGVWTVKFSPTDRIVASGAADRTVRLWSLDDFTCLKVGGHCGA